jgi:hypothetical protein
MLDIPELCTIPDCNDYAERMHLVSRAVLPKEYEWDSRFYIYACRRHHSEAHNKGIDTFCSKYGIENKLMSARNEQSKLL